MEIKAIKKQENKKNKYLNIFHTEVSSKKMKKLIMCLSALIITMSVNAKTKLQDILPSDPWNFTPGIENREFWNQFKDNKTCKTIIKKADSLLNEKITAPPVESYMEYYSNGNRLNYERKYSKIRSALKNFVIAACLTNDHKYVKKAETVISELCTMKTWVLPAHDRKKYNITGKKIDIDLVSSDVAWKLTTVINLLKPVIDPQVVKKAKDQILLKVINPFDAMVSGKRHKNWWITGKNNWNSVCLSNIGGTLLGSNIDQSKRIRLLEEVINYSNNFLKGFTKDGYCSEGISYWNYGFGQYLRLASALYQATNGKLNLMDRPTAKLPAKYPDKIQIAPNICPAFADSYFSGRPAAVNLGVRDYLWNKPTKAWKNLKLYSKSSLTELLLVASIPKPEKLKLEAETSLPPYSIFSDAGIVIVRPGDVKSCRFAAAFKGGSNFEFHNHNDVGSYSLVLDNELPIVGDPGLEHYSARTFSKRRYESNLINSYGHCVPVINGKLQSAGKNTYSPILEKSFTPDGAQVKINMAPAYPEVKDIVKLERIFKYSRANTGSFSVIDKGEFKKPVSFETAIITFGSYKQKSANKIIITNNKQQIEVTINTNGAPFTISSEEIKEDIRWSTNPNRIAIKLQKATKTPFIEIVYNTLK